MNRRKIAARALQDLCTFIGGVALLSYFGTWATDLKHWYITLASLITCSILWLGFYVIEMRGGILRLVSYARPTWATLRERREQVSPNGASPNADSLLWQETPPTEEAGNEPQVPEPGEAEPPQADPLAWLRRAAAAGRKSGA
jgi:hypothetical protein